MEIDNSEPQPQSQSSSQKIQTLIAPLSSSLAKLSGSSRCIPSEKDFHFYNNFDEFSIPIKEISDKSAFLLRKIGAAKQIWGKEMSFPEDLDDGYEYLVNVNDEVFERFDCSVDEFKGVRKEEEEGGFRVVYGKKKRGEDSGVKVASRDKKTMGARPRVPFHIPTIPRPQDEYMIVVNNANQPFQHVWLQSSEDGSKLVHPQEMFSALDFVDRNIGDIEHGSPLPIESTPFKLVDEVNVLKELAAKLRAVNEFAVDLEHNHYRSFQGLTCLMQISTRTEDFIVDTLKLRVHVGPYLREVFKDPTKKKIMHGADSDIIWLQRDFGIYICNLFDTGQASRVLKLERNSLEYLLNHFCGVTANKEYQQADWRLRPLPDEMVKYAREDTHYLLHIYDLLRSKLLARSPESGKAEDLLLEVYQRSYDICMQLYEKELLTESSYLHIYGMKAADFNAQQLAVVQGLCDWRDVVARAEDESTGYILPNKTLLEIAKQMPVTHYKLRQLLNSKHPYIERNLGPVVSIIRHSMQNAAAFEPVVEQLKRERMEREEKAAIAEGNEAPSSTLVKLDDPLDLPNNSAETHRKEQGGDLEHVQNGSIYNQTAHNVTTVQRASSVNPRQGSGVTVQVLKKPTSAFGAMFGSSATKRKLDSTKLEKEEIKLERIKSSVNLPFHSFVGGTVKSQAKTKEPAKVANAVELAEPPAAATLASEDVILLEGGESDTNETENSEAKNEVSEHRETNGRVSSTETDEGDEPMSLSDLSSNFKKCFQSAQQKASSVVLQVKPFDYEAARQQIAFGQKDKVVEKGEEGDEPTRNNKFDRKKSSAAFPPQKEEGENNFAPGRRRQAFPTSGNRSATFR